MLNSLGAIAASPDEKWRNESSDRPGAACDLSGCTLEADFNPRGNVHNRGSAPPRHSLPLFEPPGIGLPRERPPGQTNSAAELFSPGVEVAITRPARCS